MDISPLRVGNEDFLVTSMIERCPKSMMLRELVKNAIEAAVSAPPGQQRIEIAPVPWAGIRKLAIWNTGTGMTAEELHRMCDIASSIGKQNGLEQNFGMGAKVASLPSNPLGIRYRSCRQGVVHQVLMGKRGQAYGRLRQTGPAGETVDVLEVSAQAAADGRPLTLDWTEVVLLGAAQDQDTVSDPYQQNPGMPPHWIAEELYLRFWTLPPGLELVLRDGCNTLGGDQVFVPLGARLDRMTRSERVRAERGIAIHYLYDAPDPEAAGRLLSARGALQPVRSSAALIHRGELYDYRLAWEWSHEAPVYGITFGARNFSVLVELPDDFPLLPDGYRQFLRHAGNLQAQIRVREFAALALQHRPEWLLDLLADFAPDARHTDVLQREMSELFRTLGIRRRWWGTPRRTRPAESAPPDTTPAAALADPEGVEYEVGPELLLLRDSADIRERGLEHKAARFYLDAHQLFINCSYASFLEFAELLQREHAGHADQESLRQITTAVSEQVLIRQICRKLVFGLAKHGRWEPWQVEQATSMYSLTLAADDLMPLLADARIRVRASLETLTKALIDATCPC